MLPTFLGIGVPRSGTTWLHELLNSHPEVFVPRRRKEIHFFDRNYRYGPQWYEKFFPSQTNGYKAVGEITPHYLFSDCCPQRIATMPMISHLILILRNPIDRAYSHYRFRIQWQNYRKTFEEFMSDEPKSIEWGFYSRYLKNYLNHFSREQILILIHEEIFDDIVRTRQTIADFLGIDAHRFPEHAGTERVNRSAAPGFAQVCKIASRANAALRAKNLDWIVNLGKKLGVKQLFGTKKVPVDPMSKETRDHLYKLYEKDIRQLEAILRKDMVLWK